MVKTKTKKVLYVIPKRADTAIAEALEKCHWRITSWFNDVIMARRSEVVTINGVLRSITFEGKIALQKKEQEVAVTMQVSVETMDGECKPACDRVCGEAFGEMGLAYTIDS